MKELEVLIQLEKNSKKQILIAFDKAIEDRDSFGLQTCIAAAFRDGIDSDYIEVFKSVILEQWHEEHEDIVNIIYLILPDDVFTDGLWEIAINPNIYRKYDYELESTLRKCVHALKAIGTSKANAILDRLVETGNPNVQYALEMYK